VLTHVLMDFASKAIAIMRVVNETEAGMTLPFVALLTLITEHAMIPMDSELTLGSNGPFTANTLELVLCTSDTQ
jgi:hypothetical protein